MVVAASRPHTFPRERGFAHVHERSSPLAGALPPSSPIIVPRSESSATPQSTGVSGFPPTTVKVLAVVIAVFGIIILVVAVWKTWSWRRQRQTAASSLVDTEKRRDLSSKKHVDLEAVGDFSDVEKPRGVTPTPPTPDCNVGWVPQIRSVGVTIIAPAPIKKSSLRAKSKWYNTTSKMQYSPPPEYIQSTSSSTRTSAQSQFANFSDPLVPLPIPPSTSLPPTRPPLPPTPPATLKLNLPAHGEVMSPMQSPVRSSSFPHGSPTSTGTAGKVDKRYPRLMTVCVTFDPTLDDELLVTLGEAVRMLEGYEDGWCLVQRVGKIDAPQGVVPRFCLEERPGVLSISRPTSSYALFR